MFVGLVMHWQLITLFSNNCLKLGIPLYRLSKNPNLSVRYKYIKTCGKQANSMYLEFSRTRTNYANVTRELLSNLRKNKTQTLTSMHGRHARRSCVGCSLSWFRVQSYNALESRTYVEVFVNKIVNEQVQITLWSCSENQFTTVLKIKGVTFHRFVAIAIKRKLFKDYLFKCIRLVSGRSNILSAFTYILSFHLFVESINMICSVTLPRKTVN